MQIPSNVQVQTVLLQNERKSGACVTCFSESVVVEIFVALKEARAYGKMHVLSCVWVVDWFRMKLKAHIVILSSFRVTAKRHS